MGQMEWLFYCFGAVVNIEDRETLRSPMRFSDVELRLKPAPALGADTARVLQEFA